MSLEAMETLAAVEERLKKQRADAAAAAKQAVLDAQNRGESLIAEARKKANDEISVLRGKTDTKAQAEAKELAEQSKRSRETLRAQAKKKEEEAVSFVVERIVNG